MSTKPKFDSITSVEAMVQRHLNAHQPAGFRLNVVHGASRQDGAWWYVVVEPTPGDIRSHTYANTLADLEEIIQDSEGVDVLLVPTVADD